MEYFNGALDDAGVASWGTHAQDRLDFNASQAPPVEFDSSGGGRIDPLITAESPKFRSPEGIFRNRYHGTVLKGDRPLKMRWILTCVVAGFLHAVTPASAQDQDYEATRHAAEQGEAIAQSNLGVMYATGRGVPQDDAEAVRWYRLAAEQGDAIAQLNLGVMYATGRGVPQDDAEAVRWYRLAAEQGDARAQLNLGFMYATGRGVPQDDAEAVRWYRLAAEQGEARAQLNLGVMYDTGRGVPRDFAEAVRWYRLSAEQGNARAQGNLGVMYATGEGVPQDDAEAVRWYRLAAEQGNARAQLNLGVMYATGRGVPQDDAEAVRWYRLSAEQGHVRHWSGRTAGRRRPVVPPRATSGSCTPLVEGVPQDDAEAVRWYRLAAEQGDAIAQSNLGVMYATGRGVPQDDAEAVRWYRLSAEQGNARAQGNVGVTPLVRACRRTTLKPSGGTACPPSRVKPSPRATSGSCTPPVVACRRTTLPHTCG